MVTLSIRHANYDPIWNYRITTRSRWKRFDFLTRENFSPFSENVPSTENGNNVTCKKKGNEIYSLDLDISLRIYAIFTTFVMSTSKIFLQHFLSFIFKRNPGKTNDKFVTS